MLHLVVRIAAVAAFASPLHAQLVGDTCTSQIDCDDYLFCAAAAGDCQFRGESGERCDDMTPCLSGLQCLGGVCGIPPNAVGDACPVNGCISGDRELYCRSSDTTCQVRLTSVGADCRADPDLACGTATATDGTTTPLYCSMPTYQCAAKLAGGADCASNPAQACASPYYCSSNKNICIRRSTSSGDLCNNDPYAECGFDRNYSPGQLYPLIYDNSNGDQVCRCYVGGPFARAAPPGAFGLTSIGDDCSRDPTFACGYTTDGIKLHCAASTTTCQQRVTVVGGSCAYDYLGACGVTTDGTQLFPSIPVGSSGHADCTCVTQADVVVRPSSRARARVRRNLSLCPGSHAACPVGNGFECIDTESNLEQCGGCTEQGGIDCTAVPGVAAVGCVGGRCEIWACDTGLVFDGTTGICIPA